MNRWMTSGGSAWWYADDSYAGEASLDQTPPGSFGIESVVAVTGRLTDERVHELLWITQRQFVGMRICCAPTPALRSMLDRLAAKSLATYRPAGDSPTPRLELLSVEPPRQESEPAWAA